MRRTTSKHFCACQYETTQNKHCIAVQTFTLLCDFCSYLVFHRHSTSLELNLIEMCSVWIEKKTPFFPYFSNLFQFSLMVELFGLDCHWFFQKKSWHWFLTLFKSDWSLPVTPYIWHQPRWLVVDIIYRAAKRLRKFSPPATDTTYSKTEIIYHKRRFNLFYSLND